MTSLHHSDKTSPFVISGQKSRGAVAVGGLAVAFAANALSRKGAVMSLLLADWAAIAGPALAVYTTPEKLTKGAGARCETNAKPAASLLLKVDPARAVEVQSKVPQLIERINRALGYNAVGTIRLVQAPVTRKPRLQTSEIAKPNIPVAAVPETGLSRLDRALVRMKSSLAKAESGNI